MPKGDNAGRKPFEPSDKDRMTVAIQAACGLPQALIAEKIINPKTGRPVDLKTLRRAFRKELDEGEEQANAIVAQSLFKKATGTGTGAVAAAIFWLKTRAGWKETVKVENTGKDGGPIEQAITHSVQALSDEDLERIARTSRA